MSRIIPLASAVLLLCAHGSGADDLTRHVQEELRKRNLFFGDIDGRPTPGFAAALTSYQQRKGFTASGTLTDETLSSFGLRPPSTLPATWPDVPVLKSDGALRTAALTGPPAPTPTPAPPPAAAVIERPAVTDDVARLFVERYLLAGQSNDAAAEAAFYADRVEYFDQGKVDRSFIERDIRRYDARWPKRYFAVEGAVRVVPDDDPAHVTVEATYRFDLKGRKYNVQGKVGTTYTLAGDRPEGWKIVRVKEERLHR